MRLSCNSHHSSPSFLLNEGQRAKTEPRINPQSHRQRERGPVSEGPVGVLMNRLFLLINVSTRAAEAGGGGGGGDPDKGCPVAVRDTQEDLRR